MKKITASALSLLVFMGASTSALGQTLPESERLLENKVQSEVEQETYEYVYEGVEYVSQNPLSIENLELLNKMARNPMEFTKSEISPMVIPGEEYDSIMEYGPYYQHHNNMTSRAVLTAVGWFIGEKFKLNKVKSALIAGGVFVASEKFLADTYVGTWQYKSWNNNVGMYEHFITLVHYTNNSYTQPEKIYNYSNGFY